MEEGQASFQPVTPVRIEGGRTPETANPDNPSHPPSLPQGLNTIDNADDPGRSPFINKPATLEIISLYKGYSVTIPSPPSQPLKPTPVGSTPSSQPPDPATILAILQFVGAATMLVCEAIDKAIELDHEERQALKDLRKGVENLKSDTMVYKILVNAIETDTGLNGRSPYTRFTQRYVTRLTHMLTGLIIYNITDKTEMKQWKVLKERSKPRDCCSRSIQRAIVLRP